MSRPVGWSSLCRFEGSSFLSHLTGAVWVNTCMMTQRHCQCLGRLPRPLLINYQRTHFSASFALLAHFYYIHCFWLLSFVRRLPRTLVDLDGSLFCETAGRRQRRLAIVRHRLRAGRRARTNSQGATHRLGTGCQPDRRRTVSAAHVLSCHQRRFPKTSALLRRAPSFRASGGGARDRTPPAARLGESGSPRSRRVLESRGVGGTRGIRGSRRDSGNPGVLARGASSSREETAGGGDLFNTFFCTGIYFFGIFHWNEQQNNV